MSYETNFLDAVRLQLFVLDVRNSSNRVLEYNRATDKLRPWEW